MVAVPSVLDDVLPTIVLNPSADGGTLGVHAMLPQAV